MRAMISYIELRLDQGIWYSLIITFPTAAIRTLCTMIIGVLFFLSVNDPHHFGLIMMYMWVWNSRADFNQNSWADFNHNILLESISWALKYESQQSCIGSSDTNIALQGFWCYFCKPQNMWTSPFIIRYISNHIKKIYI